MYQHNHYRNQVQQLNQLIQSKNKARLFRKSKKEVILFIKYIFIIFKDKIGFGF